MVSNARWIINNDIYKERQMNTFNRILALSPHGDDAELGAGGTIARFIEEGREVYHVVFSGCEQSIPEGMPKDLRRIECKNSCKVIGIPSNHLILLNYELRAFPEQRQHILEEMLRLNQELHPDLVLVPSHHDIHQDHRTIHGEAIRAFKKTSSIWGYEHPWNNLTFSTDIFVCLERKHMNKKIKALSKHLSQKFRTYMNKEYVLALAQSRGSQVDLPYAEAFQLVRLIY